MKVRVEFSGPANDPGDEYDARCEVRVDGHIVAIGKNFGECPEDANLGRGLGWIYDLPSTLRAAHDAGKRGEPFSVECVAHSDWQAW